MLVSETILQKRYRIIRQLGQGGMGAVYEAIDERLDKTVAIKEILLELETASDGKQRTLIKKAFRREANSLVKAKHEAVPDVTDYFSELDRQFLVMEFIAGNDLFDTLQKTKEPFSLKDVTPWVIQLLEALDYLHHLKPPIIHRDIKPQNLKLNEWQKIKLLDFGIAKSTDKNSTLTQNTFVGATLNYSPIEQVLRVIDPTFREFILLKHCDKAESILNQTTDPRCDIFALGATIFHLLTNQAPIDITKRALEIWEKRNDPLINPSQLNPEIPKEISSWLLKAMAFDRDDRFATASEMREALNEAITEERTSFQPIKQEILLKDENNTQEQILMQAETERLIKVDRTRTEEAGEISSPALPSPTKPSIIPDPDTFSYDEKTPTDYKLADTALPTDETSNNLSELAHFDNTLLNEQEEFVAEDINVTPSKSTASIESTPNNRKYFFALPIIGVLSFAIFGGGLFGIVSLMSDRESPSENKTIFENANVNNNNELDATKVAETNSNSSRTNLSSGNETGSNKSELNEPLTTATPSRKPNTAPVKKSPVRKKSTPRPTPKALVKSTPKPTPISTPKPQNPNCIYNGDCE